MTNEEHVQELTTKNLKPVSLLDLSKESRSAGLRGQFVCHCGQAWKWDLVHHCRTAKEAQDHEVGYLARVRDEINQHKVDNGH